MSSAARQEVAYSRESIVLRTVARRIQTKVEDAQDKKEVAGRRWPFELLQNAHDAGPRPGAECVDLDVFWDGVDLVVTHTGRPFTPDDLNALLYGGSSKDFVDEETTGRFGTGFMVTHALSVDVDVDGLLHLEAGDVYEHFSVELRRGGDEEAIVANTERSDGAIDAAEPATLDPAVPTVRLLYRGADAGVVEAGLDELVAVAPYLYATCRHLGRIRIDRPGRSETFEPGPPAAGTQTGHITEHPALHRSHEGSRRLAVLRSLGPAGVLTGGRSSVLVLVEDAGGRRSVVVPAPDFPRVFVQFPIIGSEFLPFGFVIEGRFKTGQERDRIQMMDEDKVLLEDALAAVPALLRRAVEEGWEGGHTLARLAAPTGGVFVAGKREEETAWWRAAVAAAAREAARCPVVRVADGRLLPVTAPHGEPRAAFVVAAATADGVDDPDLVPDTHALALRLGALAPVALDLAGPWGHVARSWAALGVAVDRLGLTEIVGRVKAPGQTLRSLPVRGSSVEFVAAALTLAGRLRAVDRALFAGLLPDQNEDLRGPAAIALDGGVSNDVKDAASRVDLDVRASLLHHDLVLVLEGHPDGRAALEGLGLERTTEPDVVRRVIERLRERLPDGTQADPTGRAIEAAAALACCIDPASPEFRDIPLVLADGSATRPLGSARYLAPVDSWPEDERPYADLYTERTILHPEYAPGRRLHHALGPAVASSAVFQAIPYTGTRGEVDRGLLRHHALTDAVPELAVVRGESFEQIALFSTVVAQRCDADPDLAERLADFVIRVAARRPAWRETVAVRAFVNREPIPLDVRAALWPAELATRRWVPLAPDGDDERVMAAASPVSLDPYVTSDRLQGNDDAADLLHDVFGFGRLELTLRTHGDGQDRADVEDRLARLSRAPAEVLAGLAQAEPDVLAEVAAAVERRRKAGATADRNRQFGLAVQVAVREAVEAYGLDLNLVDRGFDYEVGPGEAPDDPAAGVYTFEAGPYLLEVKATTVGEVRLTPLQAATATEHSGRFVLCVVDLHGVTPERLSEPWTAADVEPRARLYPVGPDLAASVRSVVDLVNAEGVRVRNTEHLRYGVPEAVWSAGVSVREWVAALPLAAPPTSSD